MSNFRFQPPAGLGWSVIRRPKFGTITQDSKSQRSQLRIAKQGYPIWEYELTWNYLKGAQATGIDVSGKAALESLLGFYLAMKGGYDTFLYEDPNDNFTNCPSIGTGDGSTTAFQLYRLIGNGGALAIVQDVNQDGVVPFQLFKHDYAGAKNFLMGSSALGSWGHTLGPPATVDFILTGNATMSPDGSNNAVKIFFPALGSQTELEIQQDTKTVPIAGETWTFSVWLKADSPQTVVIRTVQSTGENDTSLVCNVTTQWQRFVQTKTCASVGTGNFLFRVGLISGFATGPATVYMWGPQAEISSSASTYVQTGPFINTVPWGPTLQYPFARTNLIKSSQAFNNGVWSHQNNMQVTDNAVAAPDGTTTASSCTVGSGGVAFQAIVQTPIASSDGVTRYTLSFWTKVNNNSSLDFGIFDVTAGSMVNMTAKILYGNATLSGGTSGATVTVTNMGSRWIRICATMNAPIPSGHGINVYIYAAGTTTTTVGVGSYIWGVQFESITPLLAYWSNNPATGAQATSYIPNSSTSSTATVTDYSLGPTALVTFASPPPANALLSWSGKYLTRVRFAEDSLDFEEFMFQLHKVGKVKLESVIL